MVTVNISLPESLKAFLDDQVAAGGYRSASAFLQRLLRQAQKKASIEEKLLAGIAALDRGEGSEMTAQDWKRLGKEFEDRHKRANPRKTS
jgi:antitoxin ParD1/3/4